MALSKSLPKGQFPVLCNLCEKDNKISWKCIDCDLLMCINCKDRIHIKIKNSRNHKVISTKDIGNQTEQLDLSNIQCREHTDQVNCMFCKSCDRLVCPLCISNVHNGHGLVDIKQGYQIKTERLKKGQDRVIANSDMLFKTELKIKEIKKAENDKYIEAKENLRARNRALKQNVDQYTQNLEKELDKKWENFNKSTKTEEDRVVSLLKNQNDKNSLVQEILNSNDAQQILDERTELEKSLIEELEPLKLDFTPIPIFVPGNIVQRNVGSLQHTSPFEKVTFNVLKEYTTDISMVIFISPCDDSLWIADNNTIQRVQPEVNDLMVVSSFDKKVYGIAVTPSNDLLIIPKGGTALKKMNTSTGELYDTVYSIDPYKPTAVHVTRDNKVMVGGKNSKLSRAAVIMMDAEGKHKIQCEYNENNQPIFTCPKGITCTSNGNIFVVDKISDDDRRVVVLGQDGDVINIYIGHSEINTEQKPFKPVSAVTTPLDNTIVTDLDTEILHILNNEGHLITHINARDFGIVLPFTFTFTTSGNGYIGCSTRKRSTDNAKLYQVKMSGF